MTTPFISVLSQINPVRILRCHLFQILFIITSHFHLGIPNVLFPKVAHQTSVRMRLELITQYFADSKNHESPLHAVSSRLLFLPLSYAEGCKIGADIIIKGKVINV
jgi:hypothetical protein